MHYYFAPMEGVTGAVYRRTHHEFFSGVDKYFMPFITPTTNEKLTPRQKRDDLPEDNYNDDDDDDTFDEDKLTEESYRTTFDTDPEDLNLEAADVTDDDDY